ncbi:MAG: M1 family aminopeptidase [Cyclobacteriaceae bacterium]|nr:M1 family aminopeptidase [Cyclobacteriaceae bacterium]
MLWKIFLFEVKYRLKRPATWAYFAIIFLFALISGIYGNSPASEKVFVNSSYAIGQFIIILSIFEMLIASAVMGVPVYRDIEYQTKDYFFAYPIREKSYLMGRFLGSFVILLLISFGYHLGTWIGGPIGVLSGEIEPEQYGPFVFHHYLYNTLVLGLPNLFFTGTVFFSLVVLTRKIVVTYVGSVILFVGYLLANALTRDLDNKTLVDILDPFALTTYVNATKYWTPAEQNVMLIPLTGNFLWNRILWIGLSLVLFLFTYFRFSFRSMLEVSSGKITKEDLAETKSLSLHDLPVVQKIYSRSIYFQKMLRLSVLEFRNIIKDFYFVSILLAGVLFLFLDGWFGSPIFGTPSLPVTYYMLEAKDADYIIFVFIIIIFYTGEVVHRDKLVHYANISDALPIPNWVVYGSKFLSLALISFVLVNLVLLCGVLNQIIKGYFNFEFSMYFTDLYLIEFPEYIQLVMLAFIVHILVNNKFVGHVISIGIWVAFFGLRNFAELNYNLFFYSYGPGYVVSDMNGFGHFFKAITWFNVYWLSLGTVFLIIGNLFWNRGAESGFGARWKLARQRFNAQAAIPLTFFTLLWVGCGAFIYYNVSVLNVYHTIKEGKRISADFEKKYKRYEFSAQPKIADVKVNIDIFPTERYTKAAGIFTIVNKTNRPIDSLMLNIGSPIAHTKIETLKIDGLPLKMVMEDSQNRFFIYVMPRTMEPGDTMKMDITMDARYRGFPNSGLDREIVYNGTFFDLGIFPSFGYPGDPMTSDKDRKKYGLPKKDYVLPPQTDPWGLSNLLFNDDADYVTFEAVVSTEPDQIAVAPGYIQKEWEENGRKYYHYKMDNEMDLFFNISSARYAVLRDTWIGAGGNEVNIEIFHHPSHTYNLDRYVKSIKASLTYYAKNFRPYQYDQIRVLEFPRYASFAQSFPNTVPYSESFGWVADFSDPDDTDYSYYVTAHEVAHQWWGHQVTPSATRGANQLSESMAEYSALMVLQHEYGKDVMQNRLKYSLDRYLRGRAGEDKFEETLLENDSRSYVWYDKGSLVLYALQDLIGEDSLNAAFKKFIDTAAFRQKPPFPTSNEWYSYINAATPDSLKYFIEDAFEKITLYENRIINADYKKMEGENYRVTMTVQTRKIYYDGQGKEKETGAGKDLIDIGIFAEDGKNDQGMKKKVPLYLKKHWLTPGEHVLEFVVEGKPVKAGIDPYNKLIDRIPDDNLKTVDESD